MVDNQNIKLPPGPGQPAGVKNLIVKRRKFLIVMAAFGLLGTTLLVQSEALIVRDPADTTNQSNSEGGDSPQLDVNNDSPSRQAQYMRGEPDQTTASCETTAAMPTAILDSYKLKKCTDFNTASLPDGWRAYNGGGKDVVVGDGRQAAQCTVSQGRVVLAQNAKGATCGLTSDLSQRYGYWEVKMRAYSTGDGQGSAPRPSLLLWPDSGRWTDGELDYFEANIGDDHMKTLLRCVGDPGKTCYQSSYKLDFGEWHVYGFEWRPDGMKGFVDGKEIFSIAGTGAQPAGSMHQTIQLDNLTKATPVKPAKMEIDWAHMYAK